jgi:hypothetical protein
LLAEVRVDQKRSPSQAPGDSAAFLTLATVDITSGSVRVVLGNDASGGTLVVADAVRIVPGTIASPPGVVAGPGVVDDGEAGYTESAYGWYSLAWWTKGYQTDSRFAAPGDGRSTATWEQSLAPGSYTVQASWFGYHNNVSNAPYRIYDGDRLVAEVRVDQKRTPASAPGDPAPFLTLATVGITSGSVRVVLGNDASGGIQVVADAVRIMPSTIVSAPDLVARASVVGDGVTGLPMSVTDEFVASLEQAGKEVPGTAKLASVARGELPMNTNALEPIPTARLENTRKFFDWLGESPDTLTHPWGLLPELPAYEAWLAE